MQQERRQAQHVAHSLQPWDRREHTGTVECVTEVFFAIHVGLGVYQLLELAADLNGIVPEVGRLVHLSHDGRITVAPELEPPSIQR